MKKIIALCLFAISLSASAWQPKNTVQLVIPFPPGGSTDVIGRIVAEGFHKQGISNLIVVNRPGANGLIGTNSVISAKPDGNTLLLTGTAFLFNKLQNTPGADYDLLNSLDHVGLIGTVPNNMYSREGLSHLTLKEIIQNTKEGQQYTWGVSNPGAEFTVQLIQARLGVKLNIIPYKGSAQVIADLVGGHIDFVIDSGSSSAAAAAVSGKRINFVATLESKANSSNTIDSVVPGVVTSSWFGLSLPKDTDSKIVSYYNRMLINVLRDPEVVEKLNNMSVNIKLGPPKVFTELIQSDNQKYSKLANASKK
jgi:tripartite-type tricarboxylate transporter receptor subunit TctC